MTPRAFLWAVLVTMGLGASLAGAGSVAIFTGQAQNPSNTFTTAGCFPNNTGFVDPSAQAADSGGDGDGFEVDPTYAFGDGALYARNYDGPGDRHRYYNYGISIPAGCSVTGIEVRLDWWLSSTIGANSMSVELSWDGGASWTSAKTDSTETTSEHTAVLGGSADGWGRTWTSTNLSNANFRVRVTSNSDQWWMDFALEWVPVKVHYGPGPTSTPTPTATATATSAPTYTPTPTPTIALVQKNYGAAYLTTSVSATFDATPVVGHLLVAIVGASTTSTINTPSGWSTAINQSGAPGQAIFYKIAGSAESSTVTVTVSNSLSVLGLQIYEYSGIATTSPLDQTNSSTGTSSSPSSGSVTTTQANELLIVGTVIRAVTSYSGWTNSFNEQFDFQYQVGQTYVRTYAGADRVVTATGTYSTTATTTVSGAWRGQIATFKAAP